MNASPEASLRLAAVGDAAAMFHVIRTAFAARRPVDPPAAALSDTVADVESAIRSGHGICLEVGDELVACLLVEVTGDVATFRRVSVLPEHSGTGHARQLVEGAVSVAADLGCRTVELLSRREFPELLAWWQRHGFSVVRESGDSHVLARRLPVLLDVPTADDMHRLGGSIASLLRKGDVIIASGGLGAGKTTLAQGIGEGLRVQGQVTSPTFIISRFHEASADGPSFVHVDAYRLGDGAELADIDLDESLADSVTMVEWGEGMAEWLSDDRLEISIDRSEGDDVRTVLLDGVGPRWTDALEPLRELR